MAENNSEKQGQQGRTPGGKDNKPKFNLSWVLVAVAVAMIGIQLIYGGNTVSKIEQWRELEQMIVSRDITKIVVVNKEFAQIFLTPDALNSGRYPKASTGNMFSIPGSSPNFIYNFATVELFEKSLNETQEQAGYQEGKWLHPIYETHTNYFGEVLGWILPFGIILLIWLFIFKRMAGGGAGGGAGNIFSVGKSKAQIFDKDSKVRINFSDVAGLEEAKTEVMEIVDFLKNPKKYTALGGKIPKGALLVGPPGTGKTLLAKAVAGEANVPFFSISGSDFVEMFVGVGASRVRDLFKQAKEKAPCIVFIDEIDAVGRARGRNANFGANDERENTLNQLLTEMDGFGTNIGVIILAATNRADILDRALLRAGRFDRQIHVELPDLNERREIFKVHLRPLKLEKDFDLEFLSKQTPGFSGADIANVCNEAALIAARKNKKEVERQDFLDAVDRIIGGLERKNKIISVEEKRTIAYHEAGHATVSWLLENASPLVKVTIIPRGRALGAAWYLPEERSLTTRDQILDELAYALGGRAAEEIVFGRVSTGALNDLERVTKQAYAMVTYFGMSEKVGNLSFYDSSGQNEYGFTKPYSEKTAELIDSEAKRIVDESFGKAKEVLNANMKGLKELADLLLEKEVIFSEDLVKIFGPRKGDKPEMLAKENGKKRRSGKLSARALKKTPGESAENSVNNEESSEGDGSSLKGTEKSASEKSAAKKPGRPAGKPATKASGETATKKSAKRSTGSAGKTAKNNSESAADKTKGKSEVKAPAKRGRPPRSDRSTGENREQK
ncbi:MAG: ATP-dependent zinc metalloprotease FtsH [Bacteroidales bacterium]|nr:ATP-dependent zinc metalloprotease FtsH [Bacteroidales bacterium]